MAKKRKFADGGSARYPKEKIPFKPDAQRYDSETGPSNPFGIRGKESQARGLEMNAEGVKDVYEQYKLPKDPSTKELIRRLRTSDKAAPHQLSNATNAALSSEIARDRETVKSLKAATPSASDVIKGYKKGGAVKFRGDGLAQRGRTKGRFV